LTELFIKSDNPLLILVYGLLSADLHALGIFAMLTIKGYIKAITGPGHYYSGDLIYKLAH
jgi:hypothetical protein